ncbi:delta-1-pyrroline-5-carboxylate dehydrogenase, mitochondrial-like [Teleopsis dalmanni]|uniref:delta-1-pyrroline-5-carboxylate dehydrogenase, mitochondrial-like n=1 Tax=Teleopsis dalmanni TaxID=139649 RepID=UPI0018CE381B|nr:delta-1-pyrroline-5-carboxylate dehydrogenase, mitochondrial-like [Teleopsis dalmanni]
MFGIRGHLAKSRITDFMQVFVRNCRVAYNRAKPMDYENDAANRNMLRNEINVLIQKKQVIPTVIAGEEICANGEEQQIRMPHKHKQILARFQYAESEHYKVAMDAAMRIREQWITVSPKERVEIWMKTADLLEKEYRHRLNAAIILGQGKTCSQADEDTCALVNFLRASGTALIKLSKRKLKNFNADEIDARFKVRAMNGFVVAIGPFNMTSISAGLAALPALVGNAVVWKPSDSCLLSSYIVYQAFQKAGLLDGIISFLPTNDEYLLRCLRQSEYFVGVNFTGKTETFNTIWNLIRPCIRCFRNFPRLASACGAKNFHFVHKSADVKKVVNATIDAAFIYSGQHCTACSRLYAPQSKWAEISEAMKQELDKKNIGDPTDFSTFSSAVINDVAFRRIINYINDAEKKEENEIVYGGGYSSGIGYYVEPTVIVCKKPFDPLMTKEIFGPILSVYLYKDDDVNQTFELISKTSEYAFNGAVFARDEEVIKNSKMNLRYAASNLFINNGCRKSTNQQNLFHGTRQSGNRRGATVLDRLIRWCSPQLIETTKIKDDECKKTC